MRQLWSNSQKRGGVWCYYIVGDEREMVKKKIKRHKPRCQTVN